MWKKYLYLIFIFYFIKNIVCIICYVYYINYFFFINYCYNCNYNMNIFLLNSMKKIYEIGVNKKKINLDFFLINWICNVNIKLD